MHLEWDWEPACYKQEVAQAILEIWHQITTYSDPLHLQVKSISSTEKGYSNTEREALSILHSLKKFHHYCFTREVCTIMDHNPLVAIFKKDVATLSQRLQ